MTDAVDLPAAEVDSAVPATVATVSVEDLAAARFAAMKANGSPSHDETYRALRAEFEQVEGAIVQEWWSEIAPAGAVLTARPTPWFRTVVAAQTGAQLHRWTDHTTRKFPQVAAALTVGDGLAIRCGEILRGTAQRIALAHVFGAATSLLGVVELAHHLQRAEADTGAEADTRPLIDEALGEYRQNLRGASEYYRQAAARATQIFYFWGMIVGVIAIAILTSAVALLIDFLLEKNGISPGENAFALMITAVSAGGLGACVSAMWRISSGTFHADYEAGSTHARTIGSFRPFIGAVFGLGLYVALRAGFLPTLEGEGTNFYLAALIAFVGGFSERLAPDVFAKAEEGATGPGVQGS